MEPLKWYTNWSGLELIPRWRFILVFGDDVDDLGPPPVHYASVQGGWTHPPVAAPLRHSQPKLNPDCLVWIGIGGDSEWGSSVNSLWQAGTATILTAAAPYTFSSAFAWSEQFPTQPSMVTRPEVPVDPGDHVYCSAWVGTEDGHISLDGGWAWAVIRNSTKQKTTVIHDRLLKPTRGITAEWIVERGGVDDGDGNPNTFFVVDLADYGSVTIDGAYAFVEEGSDFARGMTPMSGKVPYRRISMEDPPNAVLSTVHLITENSMRFTAYPLRNLLDVIKDSIDLHEQIIPTSHHRAPARDGGRRAEARPAVS